jgi:hypothetical protein
MTHHWRGPLTALAYALIIGTPSRFPRGKQIARTWGMIRGRLSGASNGWTPSASKVNSLLRFLWWRQAQAAARIHPSGTFGTFAAVRRHKSIPRYDGTRLGFASIGWNGRNGCEYSPSLEFGSYVDSPVTGHAK